METRICRWCEEGPGTRPGGPCPGCKYAKQLKLIVPGPKHPAMVKGAIRDQSELLEGPTDVVLLMESREPLKPIGGAQEADTLFNDTYLQPK
ncbi:MAG: hypothetical protein U0931_30080 [Vulcanimicrobiota bacterium]